MIDLTNTLGQKVALYNNQCIDTKKRIHLLAKAEFLNPDSQSHKDRIAQAIIVAAEERGELIDSHGNKKTILAASSGNTGLAVSKIGTRMGYKVVIITDKNVLKK